jgi:hypothetical protein
MDITPQDSTTQQPISDDQELAKALAGVLPGTEAVAPAPAPAVAEDAMKFEETPVTAPAAPADDAVTEEAAPAADPAPDLETPEPTAPAAPSGDLENIKKDALNDLRPLIDKVDLPAEEKFDTYLMLIRSTDDTSLVQPAYAAAQSIADEKRRAEALLEIVKEIDYLSRGSQPAA